MELKKIILKNFRAHKSLTLDFNHGVTGICGGNGTGKSSIVEAIMFLLTGEGYGKLKSEMLTVGTSSGYVIGHLVIAEKEAVLERHIDTAKVNFKYDGKVYKKSSEVAELWNSLFQIDKHIVQNVVISNQGEIALLFNGDEGTKEKLFQKIFMVPNTTKLRDMVWNNYIKTAPPEYPVKDLTLLQSNIQVLEKIIDEEVKELSTTAIDEQAYENLIARKSFLAAVANSEGLSNKYEVLIPSLDKNIAKLSEEKSAVEQKLELIDIEGYRQNLRTLEAAKPLYAMKLEMQSKKASLSEPSAKCDAEEFEKARKHYNSLEGRQASLIAVIRELSDKVKEYETSGVSSGICPTCGTKLNDLLSLIEHTKLELAIREQEMISMLQQIAEAKNAYTELESVKAAWDAYNSELIRINSKLEAYNHIEYNEDDHKLYSSVVAQYDFYTAEVKKISGQIQIQEAELNSAKIGLAGIARYDKDIKLFAQEQQDINNQIELVKSVQEKTTALKVSLGANKKELEGAEKELKENKEYVEKNAKRKKYVDILHSLYDIFHTTKFPRALIQTYASTVTEYMNDVLESFDFPYSAKVNESFGIDVYDSEGHRLPSISGGQQVMVGFSLRLALHHMFVGAFPFMIIDEGSYGLAEETAKKYFNIIAKLNKASKFKQVIVIDHHKELSDYVDHTILL
jgi:DNA repair exonuclease SbcCD ATPase subunit